MVGKSFAAAGVLAAVVGGAVVARADDPSAAQSTSGLSLTAPQGDPSVIVERTAQAGASDVLKVSNNSREALDITVKARPWTQSASGVTSPNRRRTLGGVAVGEESFTLARGASKDVTVTLNSAPAYLYGAVEVIGLPSDLATRKGVVAGYRLLSSLRYKPATPASANKPGAVKVVGSGAGKALTLSVRNTGNTLDPVSGTVKLKSALGTKNGSVKATRILPGKSIRLALLSGSALKPGTYTASITLTQAKKKTTVTKKITVRR